MASKEVELRTSGILDDLQWARAAAQAQILPAAFRARPANLVVAAQLGRALGLHPMIAVTQIYVVDGKPSTSSLLISALVRQAGHKLRIQADNTRATVVIVRKDDPDFEYTVTWRLKKGHHNDPTAEEAGLLNKDNWRKYGAAMLTARAIAQCARMACGEALLGVAHTTEELAPDMPTDEYGGPVKTERVSFEDMYAEQIKQAQSTTELKRLHGEASTAGVLKVVPTGEELTILKLLNIKMRELKRNLPDNSDDDEEGDDNEQGSGRTEGESGSGVSEAMGSEASVRSGQDYLNPPKEDDDDPAYASLDQIVDAEIVTDDENGHSL